jgi:uncharacterized membrane protein (UPF0127 family)
MNKWLFSLLLMLSSCAVVPDSSGFPLVKLQLEQQTIDVQLADTPELRAQGLMFQDSAEPGMLLLYSEPQHISLWMRNTGIALDVAFIDANWQIHQIRPLAPFDETPVPSEIPVIAALEMPSGWFAAHKLGVGSQLKLLTD